MRESRLPGQFSQKTLISKFFRRAGYRFGIIGDLMAKGDTQAEIGAGRPSGLIQGIFVLISTEIRRFITDIFA